MKEDDNVSYPYAYFFLSESDREVFTCHQYFMMLVGTHEDQEDDRKISKAHAENLVANWKRGTYAEFSNKDER